MLDKKWGGGALHLDKFYTAVHIATGLSANMFII